MHITVDCIKRNVHTPHYMQQILYLGEKYIFYQTEVVRSVLQHDSVLLFICCITVHSNGFLSQKLLQNCLNLNTSVPRGFCFSTQSIREIVKRRQAFHVYVTQI